MRTVNDRQIGLNETKQRIGFTLIELLVVISVIALLMGILVPVLGKARGTAKRVYCEANLRQIGVAFRAYLDDNRDKFPLACAFPWEITDVNDPAYNPPITKVLSPILKDPKVFICSADTVKKYYLRVGNTSYWYNGTTLSNPPDLIDGMAGKTIREYFLMKEGIKEKNIEVMSDFDPIHPGFTGTYRKRVGQKNYLYADWHVSNYVRQD